MHENFSYADLILPLPLAGYFTYAIPDNLKNTIGPGQRVIVQFGVKKIFTAIVKVLHNSKPEDYETKEILSILDETATINNIQFTFWQWISEYYLCSQGEVFKAALPSGLKLESETRVVFNTDFDKQKTLSADEALVTEVLKSKQSLSIKEIQSITKKKNTVYFIKNLLEKGVISIYENIKDQYKPKTEHYVVLNGNYNDPDFINKLFDDLKNARKQLKLVLALIEIIRNGTETQIPKKILLEKANAQHATLKALATKNIITISDREISRLETTLGETKTVNDLSTFQAKAKQEIDSSFKEKDVVLLHGITSSGKTEIYIHLIKQTIDEGKQVLYLLPEIALTAQIINRLRAVFGDDVGIYHSKFNDAERVEIWNNINKKKKSYKVILGVRSSIFLPFEDLGLIIIDEEHENTYKQYDPAPRYHARDSAIVLANIHKAKVLLGTATPSIETYFNAKTGKYGLVELNHRHKEIALPEITIVDLKKARKQKRMHSIFSTDLLDKIGAALAGNEQIILFQNRRGYSPYQECTNCGTIPGCKHCEVSLTYHKHTNSLVCHYCGYTVSNTGNCKVCASYDIETRGFGTEKIEDELQIFFPDAKLKRMDQDSTRAKNAYSTIITEFENHEIDILIGTQMVTKGLDFENVSLVGILNAENMLSIPDFRAFERAFHLMTQVAGRAGRSKKQGEVIIQSSNPENFIIRDVVNNNFFHMYEKLLKEREEFSYPPYTRLIRITLKHKDQKSVDAASELLAGWLRHQFNDRILGPEYPPVGRIQNWYMKNILIKIERDKSVQKAKDIITNQIHNLKILPEYKATQVVLNVDPY